MRTAMAVAVQTYMYVPVVQSWMKIQTKNQTANPIGQLHMPFRRMTEWQTKSTIKHDKNACKYFDTNSLVKTETNFKWRQ